MSIAPNILDTMFGPKGSVHVVQGEADPSWSVEKVIRKLCEASCANGNCTIIFIHPSQPHVRVAVNVHTDPIATRYAFELAAVIGGAGGPIDIAIRPDTEALEIFAMRQRCDRDKSLDAGNVLAELREVARPWREHAMRQYDRLVKNLTNADAPEPRLRDSAEVRLAFLMATGHTVKRQAKPMMQALEYALAEGHLLEAAWESVRYMAGLTAWQQASVEPVITDCWERGDEFGRVVRHS